MQPIQSYHYNCHIIKSFLIEGKLHDILYSLATKLMNIFQLSFISTQSIPNYADNFLIWKFVVNSIAWDKIMKYMQEE